mmetsp:Transcript_30769/g.70561  ORF Transcript_30769/g.70561 Transcript_30769/m.70561 type:complete len:288 (+) Transcript_30769:638-1501(+)
MLHHLHILPNRMRRSKTQGADVDMYWFLSAEVPGKALNLLGPSCAPHKCLSVRTALTCDLSHLGLETHIQHAVCFVKDQVGHPFEISCFLRQEINESAWCGDDNLHTFSKIFGLLVLRRSAIAASVLDLRTLAKSICFLLDLARQLSRWCHHQNNRAVTSAQVRLSVDMHNGRQEKGQRFARAGFSNANHVATGKCYWPSLDLNGRGLLEAGSGNFLQHVLWKGGLLKISHRLRNVLALNNFNVLGCSQPIGLFMSHLGDERMLLVEILFKFHKFHLPPIHVIQALA